VIDPTAETAHGHKLFAWSVAFPRLSRTPPGLLRWGLPSPGVDTAYIQPYGCIIMQAAPQPDLIFAALSDGTRRDIVLRALNGNEGVAELASHYPMSFAAVQKHVAVLERAGLVSKRRVGRRKVVQTEIEALRLARGLLEQYEALWRGRIDRMTDLIAASKETRA
jgi:DNA-binding transcriptional ArsR family regulator